MGVPKNIRLPFVSPAALAFAVFALGGFYGALAPGLLTHQLHENNVAIVGTVVTLFFGTGALVAALTGRFKHRTSLLICTALLIAGLASLLVCERESSMTWLLIASIVTGSAMALGFRSSIGMVNELAPAGQRAELISAYLLACYTANSVPVIAIGLLSRIFSVPLLHAGFAALLAFLTLRGHALLTQSVACAAVSSDKSRRLDLGPGFCWKEAALDHCPKTPTLGSGPAALAYRTHAG
jgi:MFS family permease